MLQIPANQFVAQIVTDGSGHADGFAGGSCAIFIPDRTPIYACSAETHSSTERGEFSGLLRGLAILTDVMEWTPRQISDAPYLGKWPVKWITDRESLALAVARNDAGVPFYSRRSTPDLWASFEFFEKFLDVHALFEDRCSTPEMKVADTLASDARQTLKNFYLSHFAL